MPKLPVAEVPLEGTSCLRVLSIIPPMTQLNTPYPSTAYLTGFLRGRGVDAVQEDLALGLVLALLTPQGLEQVQQVAKTLTPKQCSPSVQCFLQYFADYRARLPRSSRFYKVGTRR